MKRANGSNRIKTSDPIVIMLIDVLSTHGSRLVQVRFGYSPVALPACLGPKVAPKKSPLFHVGAASCWAI